MTPAEIDALAARLHQGAAWLDTGRGRRPDGTELRQAAAAIAALKAERDRYRELAGQGVQIEHKLRVELLAAEQQIAALKADAGAMEVLREWMAAIEANPYGANNPRLKRAFERARTLLDAAIDAARAEKL